MAMHSTLPDPVALLESLDPDRIREELDELDRRSRALRVLLRSAVARQRERGRQRKSEEVRS
jgi:hypothetical protein